MKHQKKVHTKSEDTKTQEMMKVRNAEEPAAHNAKADAPTAKLFR